MIRRENTLPLLMSALPRVLVLNGPNLNFLGRREPQIYGRTTLTDVIDELRRRYDGVLDIDHLQSNHEGVLIDRLQPRPTKRTCSAWCSTRGLSPTLRWRSATR